MSLLKSFRLFTLLLVLAVPSSRGEQPIFNEMPRWDGGWGFQFIQEYRHERDLLSGNTVVCPGFSEGIHLLHLEGVYTWDKSIRLTFKLPYVLDARRELLGIGGSKFVQHDEGFGDATVAFPLKRYFNLDGRSGSWTLGTTPTRSTIISGTMAFRSDTKPKPIASNSALVPPAGFSMATTRPN